MLGPICRPAAPTIGAPRRATSAMAGCSCAPVSDQSSATRTRSPAETASLETAQPGLCMNDVHQRVVRRGVSMGAIGPPKKRRRLRSGVARLRE